MQSTQMQYTLKQARAGVGLSQEEMAEKIGVGKQTYFNYEKDPAKMKVETLLKFVKETGVEISNLKLEV